MIYHSLYHTKFFSNCYTCYSCLLLLYMGQHRTSYQFDILLLYPLIYHYKKRIHLILNKNHLFCLIHIYQRLEFLVIFFFFFFSYLCLPSLCIRLIVLRRPIFLFLLLYPDSLLCCTSVESKQQADICFLFFLYKKNFLYLFLLF